MIELSNSQLVFRSPEVHPDAVRRIELQRTLRIPDDNRDYPLPRDSTGFRWIMSTTISTECPRPGPGMAASSCR